MQSVDFFLSAEIVQGRRCLHDLVGFGPR